MPAVFLRHRWLHLPTGLLVVLLQRAPTPALRIFTLLENGVVDRAAVVLRSSAAFAALGAYNSVAGATVINVTGATPTSGADGGTFTINGTVGTALTVGITVSGAPGNPKSYSIKNTTPLPGGIVQTGGNSANVVAPYKDTISGIPSAAGTTNCSLSIWADANAAGDHATITLKFVVAGGGGNVAPAITAQPTSQTVNAGNSVTLSVAASGTPAPTYQWQKGGANLPGATNTSYTIASVVPGDAGSFAAMATNAAGSATSSPATLTVRTVPAITTQPSSLTVTAGGTVTFIVAASGNPAPTYQWQKNGVSIPGATNPSLTIPNVALGNAGSYAAVATNAAGSTPSVSATLTVNPAVIAPTFATQPANLTVLAGGSASFTVAASGNPAPTIQWQRNGIDLPGATDSTLTIASVAPADAGNFSAVATSSAGNVASSPATLVVQVAPVIITQPSNQTVTVGGSASFTVVADGVPGPSYQWKINGGAINGATSATLSLGNIQVPDAASYTVDVSNAVGSVTSNEATLTVQTAPYLVTQPVNQTVIAGDSVTFAVVAGGSPAPTLQWYQNGVAIAGATNATLMLGNVMGADAGTYTVDVTNVVGTVRSSDATLTVMSVPVITTQPASQTLTAGGSVSFTVVATGIPAPTFQWRLDGGIIVGATNATFALGNVQTADAGSFTVDVSNSVGSVTSAAAILTVQTGPVITSQPMGQTVAVGGSASFVVGASGHPSPAFQWRINGTLIDGATNATFSLSSTQSEDAGSYTVDVTNAVGTVTSSAATLAVQTPPVVTMQPMSQSVAAGSSVSFTVAASGSPAPAFQWSRNGVILAGATNATLFVGNIQSVNAGIYTVTAANSLGVVASTGAALTVQTVPVFTTQPISQAVTVGDAVILTAAATGNPNPSYQWKLNGAALSGATSDALFIGSVEFKDSGSYTVEATNIVGSATSAVAVLTVQGTAPIITTQPASQTVTAGGSVTFSVAASGNPAPDYQWKKAGVVLAGATTATLTLSDVQSDSAGNYTVEVTNSGGAVTSVAATLIVQAAARAPVITSQPLSQTATSGSSVIFTVVANGNPAPTYRWARNQSVLVDATGATLVLSNVQEGDDGDYVVEVSNLAGTVTSVPATLIVEPPPPEGTAPKITTQPVSQTVTLGDSVTFTVAASGNPPPVFQWSRNGVVIADATGATLTLDQVQAADAGDYTVEVANVAGTVMSTAATLLVQAAAPVVTLQPASQTVTVGDSVIFAVAASGSPVPVYQWTRNGVALDGETRATLALNHVQGADAGSYAVTVTNIAGAVASSLATLTVQAAATAPVIITQPSSLTVMSGSSAVLSIAAGGNPAPVFQWRRNGAVITGATNATLFLGNVQPADAGDYTVEAANVVGTVSSAVAILSVRVAPSISLQPLSQTAIAGGAVALTVVAGGSPAPTYQWQRNGTDILGATEAAFAISKVGLDDAGGYTVVVTNSAGQATSATANLTVDAAPVVLTPPADQTIPVGGSAVFAVVASGNPSPTFQWRMNGAVIAGATGATLNLVNVQGADSGSYAVEITNSVGSVTSSAATLTVQTAPTLMSQPVSQIVTAGNSASFSVTASCNPAPAFQWRMNGVAIPGATSATLLLSNVQPADGGSYTVAVVNSIGSVSSSAAALIVQTAPVILAQPASLVVNAGSTASFSVTAGGNPAPTYQWRRNGGAIPGATNATFQLTNVQVADTGSYTVDLANSVGFLTSSASGLTVQTAPVVTLQPASQATLTGRSVTFTVAATGTPTPSYQWQRDGANLAGATLSTLTLNNVQSGDAATYSVIVYNAAGAATSNGAILAVSNAPTVYGDVNGDGQSDVILTNTTTGERTIWLMKGLTIASSVSLGVLPVEWSFSSKGDFNGDGKTDLILTNAVTGERAIWLLNGAGIGAGASLGYISANWCICGTGDFNGDHRSDILLQNLITGERLIWLMNGTRIGGAASLGVLSTDWNCCGTGDFNGDGKSDILLTNVVTGERAIWLMNGASIGAGASLGRLAANWMTCGFGDFNGDGQTDILLTNMLTGERAVWLMNGLSVAAGQYLGVLPPSWEFGGIGDYDGDGMSDIFLTNTLTGERAVWLMNGTTIVAGRSLGTLAPAWTITR